MGRRWRNPKSGKTTFSRCHTLFVPKCIQYASVYYGHHECLLVLALFCAFYQYLTLSCCFANEREGPSLEQLVVQTFGERKEEEWR